MTEKWLEDRRNSREANLGMSRKNVDDLDDSKLLADVAFNRHSMNDGHHVGPSDNATIQVGRDGVEVALVQGIDEDAFKRTLSMAVRATIGMDVSQPLPGDWEHCQPFCDWAKSRMSNGRDFQASTLPDLGCGHEEHDYSQTYNEEPHYRGKVPMGDWEEMLKGGLQTALETQTIVFAVSGVSRTCTHQLVRSRRASFHQQSQRASYMGDFPEMRMPESVFRNPKARAAFIDLALQSWRTYQICCEEDISYQDSRFALLEGTTNFIMLEYPVREFLNVYAYRACSMFQWEIVEVMRKCREVLVAAHPWLEPYVKISCEKTGPVTIPVAGLLTGRVGGDTETVDHHCTFQGWEDVEGQCDFPWAKQEARTFKPEFHRITRDKENKDG